MGNILKEANQIINERSEEKERQYGPFSEGMKRAALIASGMSGKEWTAHDMYIAMIALKFSRQSYNFKEDNLLDAAAYIGAWQNFIDEENKKSESENEELDELDPDFDVEHTIPTKGNITGYSSTGDLLTDGMLQRPGQFLKEFKAK